MFDLEMWEVAEILANVGVFAMVVLMIAVIYELIKTTKPGKFGATIIIMVLMASPIVYFIKTLVQYLTGFE